VAYRRNGNVVCGTNVQRVSSVCDILRMYHILLLLMTLWKGLQSVVDDVSRMLYTCGMTATGQYRDE
jgi:hypothetical protein